MFLLYCRWHISTIFENQIRFSYLSNLEREMFFRTEMVRFRIFSLFLDGRRKHQANNRIRWRVNLSLRKGPYQIFPIPQSFSIQSYSYSSSVKKCRRLSYLDFWHTREFKLRNSCLFTATLIIANFLKNFFYSVEPFFLYFYWREGISNLKIKFFIGTGT